MEASQYRLVLTGRVMAGFDAEDVIDRLATMLKVNTSKARAMLAGQPSVIRQGIDRETAQRFEAALKKGGIDARVEAQPPEKPQAPPVPPAAGPPPDPCPKCGQAPLEADDPARMRGECPFCGVIIARYRRNQRSAAAGTQPLLVQRMRSHGGGPAKEKSYTLTKIGVPLVLFALVCFLSSCAFNLNRETVAVKQLPPAGGIIGPITVAKDRTTYHVKVQQPIRKSGHWATVSGEVLDANKKYLFGFGKEFWAESGRDSDGYWSESVTKYDMKVNLGKGTYYLGIATERHPGVTDGIQVKVQRKSGSGLPFTIAGIMAMLLGVALVTMENVKVSSG
jgi:hypothetical protein